MGGGVAGDRESDEEENVSGGKKNSSHRCRRSHPLHKYYTGQSSELTAEGVFFFVGEEKVSEGVNLLLNVFNIFENIYTL